MAEADLTRDGEREHSNVEGKPTPDNLLEALPQEMKRSIEALRHRSVPVNILVMGPTDVGKSTLVNALLGDVVAEVHYGAKSVTREMHVHEGEFMEVKIRVCDTVGFGDTEGRSDMNILKEIPRNIRFDLILIYVRMDCRASDGVQKMFTLLSAMMHPEAWKRTVVVLTFVNFFLQQGVPEAPNEEKKEKVIKEMEVFRNQISKAVNKKIFSDVPFCIAGRIHERTLPTTDDWLLDLWRICLQHCSDDTRPLLEAYTFFAAFVATTVVAPAAVTLGAGIGSEIGSEIGSLFSAQGSALGAALGAYVGANIGMGVTLAGTMAFIRKFLQK